MKRMGGGRDYKMEKSWILNFVFTPVRLDETFEVSFEYDIILKPITESIVFHA